VKSFLLHSITFFATRSPAKSPTMSLVRLPERSTFDISDEVSFCYNSLILLLRGLRRGFR
jgi:hypothetical protein